MFAKWVFFIACGLALQGAGQGQILDCVTSNRDVIFLVDDARPDDSATRWPVVKSFLSNLAAALMPLRHQNRIGMVIFSDSARLEFPLTGNLANVQANIARAQKNNGDVNLASGLEIAEGAFLDQNRPTSSDVLIIVIDSEPSRRRTDHFAIANRMKGTGTSVIVIGVTNAASLATLRNLASRPAFVNSVATAGQLLPIAATVATDACRTPPALTTTIRPLADCSTSIDLAILVDASSSINFGNAGNFLMVKDYMKAVVRRLFGRHVDLRVGVVVFSSRVVLEFTFNQFLTSRQIEAAIDRIEYLGYQTNMDGALDAAYERLYVAAAGDRQDVDNILLMITDGRPYPDNERPLTINAANRLKRDKSVIIITVGVTPSADRTLLQTIASAPSLSQTVPTFNQLNQLTSIVESQIRTQCREPPEPTTTTVSGRTTTQRGGCLQGVDLLFLIDTSASIQIGGTDNFQLVKNFLKNVVFKVFLVGSNVRVGAIVFSSSAQIAFNFFSHTSTASIYNAIDTLPYKGHQTNFASAFNLATDVMFTAANGDRAGVENVVVLFTDGRTYPTGAWPDPITAATRLKTTHSVQLITVGVTNDIDRNLLNAFSTRKDISLNVLSFTQLGDIVNSLVAATCVEPSAPSFTTTTTTASPDPSGCRLGVDLAFLVDASASVGVDKNQFNWNFIRTFVGNVISSVFTDETRVGVIVFSDRARISFGFGRYGGSRSAVLGAVGRLAYRGYRTNMADAFNLATNRLFAAGQGSREAYPNLAILITDGRPSPEFPGTMEAVNNLKLIHKATVLTVGVSRFVDVALLRRISSRPELTLTVDTFRQLGGIVQSVVAGSCLEPAPPFFSAATPPPPPPSSPIHPSRPPPPPPPPPQPTAPPPAPIKPCNRKVDVAFLVDSSGSIRLDDFRNWQVLKNFVSRIAVDLHRSTAGLRVAALVFADNVRVQFDFNRYRDLHSIRMAISRLEYIGTSTNIAAALSEASRRFFSESGGDRPDAANVAILITDGRPETVGRFQPPVPEAERLKQQHDVHIIPVGVTSKIDRNLLRRISSLPYRDLNVNEFNQLDAIAADIVRVVSSCDVAAASTPTAPSFFPPPPPPPHIPFFLQISPPPTTVQPPPPPPFFHQPSPPSPPPHSSSAACQDSADVALLVDSSGSINYGDPSNWRRVKSFVGELVGQLFRRVRRLRVAALVFATDVRIQFNFNGDEATVRRSVERLEYLASMTNISGGLRVADRYLFQLARSGVPRVAILITDGRPQPAQLFPGTVDAANALKTNHGVFIITVGVTSNIDVGLLRAISSRANLQFSVRSFGELANLVRPLASAATIYCAPDASQVLARRARATPSGCHDGADVVFVADATGSQNSLADWQRQLQFFGNVLNGTYNVNMKYGMLVASQRTFRHFDLAQFSSRNELAAAIAAAPEAISRVTTSGDGGGDGSNLSDALLQVKTMLLPTREGNRTDRLDRIVLVTDGQPPPSLEQKRSLISVARNLKASGVRIVVAGVGRSVDRTLLADVASSPSSNVVAATSFLTLPSFGDNTARLVCP